MSALLLATAFLALTAPAKAPVVVNLDAKNGDTISGERTFKVTVQTNSIVSQVEFYVGDDLRDNATSTPYTFQFDTINENDGDVKLRFKAYTTENQTGEKVITVHIDNGISKGSPFHVQKGMDYLTESKWTDALREGRIALKIDGQSNPARILLSRANLGLNVLDKAQKYAEDAVSQDGNDLAALQTLSTVNLVRSLRTVSREGTEPTEARAAIKEALKAAVETRAKILQLQLDQAGAPTGENAVSYADKAIRAGRYSLAVNALDPEFAKDMKNNALANRLAYALVRSNRSKDAIKVLNNVKKFGSLDAYGYALLAVVTADLGDEAGANDAIREAVLADSENLGVRTAQAFLALKQSKTDTLARMSTDLAREQGQRADVNYFLSALANRQSQFGAARKAFEKGVLAEAAMPDLYVEQANTSIAISTRGKLEAKDLTATYETAKMMYETALLARPEDSEAMSGLVVVSLLQKKPADAVKYGEAAVAAAPNDGGAHYALAGAYQAAISDASNSMKTKYAGAAQDELKKAWALDPKYLEGRTIPDALGIWRYLNGYGRRPVLSAPQ